MSDTCLGKYFRKLSCPQQVNHITKLFKFKQIKLAKEIYNFQSRNISHFIKQCQDIQRKAKIKEKVKLKVNNSNGKTYDENELLQMNYQITQKYKTPIHLHHRAKTQETDMQKTKRSFSKQKKIINKQLTGFLKKNKTDLYKNQLNFPKIKKRQSERQRSESYNIGLKQPLNLLKSSIQYGNLDESINYQTEKKMQGSIIIRQSPRKSIIKIQKLIQITENKMNRYLSTLNNLVQKKYQEQKISEFKINNLILLRYSISCQRQKEQSSNSCQHNQVNPRFMLPFMEFISLSESRKSIHRIINMSVKNCQKICFKLLDFNQNSFIDQNDIINLVELSQKMPMLEADLKFLASYLQRSQKKINSQISQSQQIIVNLDTRRQNQKMQSSLHKQIKISKFKTSKIKIQQQDIHQSILNDDESQKQKEEDSIIDNKIVSLQNANIGLSNNAPCSFNKKQHFSFLQSKQNFKSLKKNKNSKLKIKINLQTFHKIFGEKRPSLFYDLMVFLFGVRKQDLIQPKLMESKQSYFFNKIQRPRITSSDQSFEFKNYDIDQMILLFRKKSECQIKNTKWTQ